jgi:peptide chain release factor 2
LQHLEEKTLDSGFWNDRRSSEKIIKDINEIKGIFSKLENIENGYEETLILVDFIDNGELEFEQELDKKHKILKKSVDDFETKLLLDGPYDLNNAIVTIHSGAGGTESCDWAEMLYRMYTRWCNTRGYSIEIYDRLAGEEAGIKSITFLVKGENAYGYLKCEKGVHRLVRISPFDANKRRHTSFASFEVTPELDDDIEIVINPQDIRIDVYRSSGAGGQHVNTTDSAVRITHLATKLVVTCQNERSQIQNRESALKVLKAKLFELEVKKKEEEIKEIKGESAEIGWGNQIRSYVFQPYTLVKDHRTGEEVGNIGAVMDGEIDNFITSFLKFSKSKGE